MPADIVAVVRARPRGRVVVGIVVVGIAVVVDSDAPRPKPPQDEAVGGMPARRYSGWPGQRPPDIGHTLLLGDWVATPPRRGGSPTPSDFVASAGLGPPRPFPGGL